MVPATCSTLLAAGIQNDKTSRNLKRRDRTPEQMRRNTNRLLFNKQPTLVIVKDLIWRGIGASCEFYTLGGVTFVTTAKWRQAGQSILRVSVS
jgi:hypothetical protein